MTMANPIRRKLKNVINQYTDAQVKVREATSNDPWGPSSTLMSEVADLSYNVVAFSEVMQMIWKRLNDSGKNWRHVYKALVLLEYILKTGSEKVAQQCKENIYAIQTLRDFQHIEDNKDQGVNVREKAKQLVILLKDDEKLKQERAKALKAKERFAQNSTSISSTGGMQQSTSMTFIRQHSGGSAPSLSAGAGGYSDPYGGATEIEEIETLPEAGRRLSTSDLEQARPSTLGEEELQLQLALAISKEEADQDTQKKRGDDVRLAMALEESQRAQGHRAQGHDDGKKKKQTLVDILDLNPAPPVRNHSDDFWSGGGAAGGALTNDPWSATQPSGDGFGTLAANDPWAPTARAKADPWASSSMGSDATSPTSNDPWSTPSNASYMSGSSPWGNGAGTHLHHDDDDFDVLMARPAASPPTVMPDGLANSNHTSTPGEPRSKTPQSFLGGHSNLVNLDNLLSKPSSGGFDGPAMTPPGPVGMNPFAPTGSAMTSYNPFLAQANQSRPTLNQMQYQAKAPQPASHGAVQAPLIPQAAPRGSLMMQPQPLAHQQSHNPFI